MSFFFLLIGFAGALRCSKATEFPGAGAVSEIISDLD
jgi:hypothetical protein